MDKLSNIVGLIKFIVILDNNGKRIYSRYFTRGDMLNDIPAQKDFEKKICQTVVNLNVNRSNEVDMFMLNEFMIACKISKEVAIFVGASQDDNECLVSSVLEIFEECLENITKNSLTKKSVMERYMQVGLLIDEMVDEGIVINTDSDYLENKLLMREPRISFEPVPSGSGGGLFRNLLSGAKSYLAKNMNS